MFIPVGFMSGIQGRLNKQFAITIAISVMISAFNALTLSPALAAMLLKPRAQTTGLLGRFFGAVQPRVRQGDARLRARQPRPGPQGARRRRAARWRSPSRRCSLGRRLPTSFVPEEDYGYFLLNVQLPPAASLERTDAVCRKIDELLAHTDGIANFNTIAGFSLLSRVTASNYGFYFIGLKPWDERTSADLEARQIVNRLNRRAAPRRARGDGVRGDAAVDSRPRHAGRLLVLAAGSQRRQPRVPEPERAEVPRRRRASGRSWPA